MTHFLCRFKGFHEPGAALPHPQLAQRNNGKVRTIRDRYGNAVYLTHERWHHIIGAMNHPEVALYEEHLQETIQSGQRRQDALNPQKYRYVQASADLPEGNTHIVAIVLFRFSQGDDGKPHPNNYIVTAYMRELG